MNRRESIQERKNRWMHSISTRRTICTSDCIHSITRMTYKTYQNSISFMMDCIVLVCALCLRHYYSYRNIKASPFHSNDKNEAAQSKQNDMHWAVELTDQTISYSAPAVVLFTKNAVIVRWMQAIYICSMHKICGSCCFHKRIFEP